MYSVVGCGVCHALWIVDGRPETTRCPRCRHRYQFKKLRAFAETEDAAAAARIRSSMLAERADDGEFVDPETIDLDGVGMDDAEFLSASGVDPEPIAAAGERSERGSNSTRSRKRAILDGLADLDTPTEEDVIAYAASAGVSRAHAEQTLAKLYRAGEVTRTDGVYRRL